MKESALVHNLLKALNAAGAKAIKIHGSAFSEAGTPDIIGAAGFQSGRAFAIECKVGRNQPTALQRQRLHEWECGGAVTAIAREDFDVAKFLANIRDGIRINPYKPE